jgi:hypothetical protein
MATTQEPADGNSRTRISRRTLAKCAAWTTPVVMMATSVPAMAQSPSTCCATQTLDAEYSGNKPAWTFHLNVTNTCTNSIRISQIQFVTMGSVFFTGSNTTAITAGSTVTRSWGKITMLSPFFSSQAQARCHYWSAGRQNEVQRITVTSTGGPPNSYRLIFDGQTTAVITHPATAAEVQAALEGLSNIQPGDVSVTGPVGGPYDVTFQGNLAFTNVPQMNSTSRVNVNVGISTITGGVATCGSPLCLNPIRTPWTGYEPCERLFADVTYALVTYQQLVSGTWVACGNSPTRVDFLRASRCGGTAGCSGTYVVP